jgi:hypothetical protein
MVETQYFAWWLAFWLFGLVVVLWSQRKAFSGVGLVLAYALQLWVIHWLAPSIYVLPWYSKPTPFLLWGLQESTYAIIGFAAGSSLVAALVADRLPAPAGESPDPLLADPWLVRCYLSIGVVAYFVQPILRPIPTIGALASVASNLLLVAFAMECWNGIRSPRPSIWRWIALTALLPFVTIVTQGFLSYGFAAMLTVFAFVATIYRPRWKVIGCGLVVSYLALSMYVTYMRDRQAIRVVVWGQESYGARLSEVMNTFADFELLDLRNFDHLARIDDRLNQNSLVGMSVAYLAARPEEFARGETIWEAALSPIPRALWRDKPMVAGSGDLVSRFTGVKFAEGTSVGIGHVLEWYVNFGPVGVFLGSLLFGIVMALIDWIAVSHLRRGDWSSFSLWYLPALSLLQVGGSLVDAVSGAATGFVIGLAIHRLRPAHLRRPPTVLIEPRRPRTLKRADAPSTST